jgi:hypothetical protein
VRKNALHDSYSVLSRDNGAKARGSIKKNWSLAKNLAPFFFCPTVVAKNSSLFKSPIQPAVGGTTSLFLPISAIRPHCQIVTLAHPPECNTDSGVPKLRQSLWDTQFEGLTRRRLI